MKKFFSFFVFIALTFGGAYFFKLNKYFSNSKAEKFTDHKKYDMEDNAIRNKEFLSMMTKMKSQAIVAPSPDITEKQYRLSSIPDVSKVQEVSQKNQIVKKSQTNTVKNTTDIAMAVPKKTNKAPQFQNNGVSKRKTSSLVKFKSDFYRPKKTCSVKSKPSSKSKTLTKIKKGKRVWVDGHNKAWAKVSLKKKKGFINKNCLN